MIIHIRKLKLISKIAQIHLHLKPSRNPRFHSTKSALQSHSKPPRKPTRKEAQAQAQAALLEYLHSTRSLQFLDAENMCKNSPFFLRGLLQKSQNSVVSRYLCYHPINEFEPFFESAGLKPSEYLPLVPRDKIFLHDDPLLLENYHTLCNYGIPRTKMGKIFKEAPQAFRYESGVLISKIRAYEKMGLEPCALVVFVAFSPSLLVGDVDVGFVKFVENLNGIVKDGDWNWIEGDFLDEGSFNWVLMVEALCLLGKVCSEEELFHMIRCCPCLVFEESGGRTLSLVAFLFKFGLSLGQISLLFVEFPLIRVGEFFYNLRQCYLFLNEIGMRAADIRKISQSHSLMMGSLTLKRTTGLLSSLNVGKQRLCRIVQDNPLEMMNWTLGRKIQPLAKEELPSKMLKSKFLLSLGYVENSEEMKTAVKLFRGNGAELQERFDFIVKAGLDCEDVCEMCKSCPQILCQTIDKINMKIECLVNEGYPVSDLVKFPSFFCYTIQRIKLRLSMYNWLIDHGAADSRRGLSTIIATAEKGFVKYYVNRHPSGLQIWQNLKAEIY